ncbi:MAG: LysR substrate-binding domain-containing protein [Pseudomonadota bacterium]
MRHVNLNALRVFATVAAHGNLQRAADALNVSRGAVSQRIKQLELDLGTALFERGARGVSLTPDGERCRVAVDRSLALLETTLSDIGAGRDRITLHLGASTATKWLMPRLAAFSQAFPQVTLATEVHDRPLSRSLGRNEIAVWPGRAPDPDPAHRSRHLTGIHRVAVCSPDLARPAGPLTLGAILTLPLLQDAHRHWDRLIRATGSDAPHRVMNFERAALALDAAMGGHGVALAPGYMVSGDVGAGRLIEIWADPDPSGQGLFVSWGKDHLGETRVAQIVDWIATTFRQS